MRGICVWFLVTASLVSSATSVQAQLSVMPTRDILGTVLIHVNWVKEGEIGNDVGTGFVINGHVVTVAHHFPVLGAGDSMFIEGITEEVVGRMPRQKFPLEISVIERRSDIDMAVLRPTTQPTLITVPVDWDVVPKETDDVWIRGFPLGGPLEGMPGKVRATPSATIVKTSALLRTGYSGAPVYNASGTVVGLVQGGEPVANVDDRTVMGLGIFVALSRLSQDLPLRSVLTATTEQLTLQRRQQRLWLEPPTATIPARLPIRVAYTIDVTKDDHPVLLASSQRTYSSETFKAAPGYRIISFEVQDHSANHVSGRRTVLASDGGSIRHDFTLESGPLVDQWRGWLTATINTVQEPIEGQVER